MVDGFYVDAAVVSQRARKPHFLRSPVTLTDQAKRGRYIAELVQNTNK